MEVKYSRMPPLGFRIPHQRNPHLLGGGFPGDVVIGGAQAADGQDQIAPGKGLGQRLADRRWFIAGHRLAMNMYAGFLQSGCNFPGIGIQNIAGEHLIAHRYDLTVQIHSLLLGRQPLWGCTGIVLLTNSIYAHPSDFSIFCADKEKKSHA